MSLFLVSANGILGDFGPSWRPSNLFLRPAAVRDLGDIKFASAFG